MKWNFISFRFWSMNLVIFLRNFDGFFILSEFHGYSQKMMKCLEIFFSRARVWGAIRKKDSQISLDFAPKIIEFFRIYKICILLHRSNLGNFANLRQNFVDFSWNFAKSKLINYEKNFWPLWPPWPPFFDRRDHRFLTTLTAVTTVFWPPWPQNPKKKIEEG